MASSEQQCQKRSDNSFSPKAVPWSYSKSKSRSLSPKLKEGAKPQLCCSQLGWLGSLPRGGCQCSLPAGGRASSLSPQMQGCQASQSCRWQICHVVSDFRESGKGEAHPRTATVLERVAHWSGSWDFCIPSDFYQSKPHTSIVWGVTLVPPWSHLRNQTRSFLKDVASSM